MKNIKKTLLSPQADLLLEISWEVCNKIGAKRETPAGGNIAERMAQNRF